MVLLPYDLGSVLILFGFRTKSIQFDYVRICSIIELTISSVYDFVRLPNDYVRLSSIEILFDFVCR